MIIANFNVILLLLELSNNYVSLKQYIHQLFAPVTQLATKTANFITHFSIIYNFSSTSPRSLPYHSTPTTKNLYQSKPIEILKSSAETPRLFLSDSKNFAALHNGINSGSCARASSPWAVMQAHERARETHL